MAAAWMLTEMQLKQLLDNWVLTHSGETYALRLFQNDYTPVDGTVTGDLEECDFDGYSQVSFDIDTFDAATWTPYTAQILIDHFLTFTAEPDLAEPQTAYGYWVEDGDSNLAWVERWETPFEFDASSVLNIKPALRTKTCRE